ncbi:hemerythrin domain-containing protein [Actinoplanes sp. NPDC051411]|uniref:hemerythrin domain-containing protein n=1 Tax=Actinoplanes sp. NPDC051411 TaxID=3155522 RepID=UPI003421E092
MATRHLDRAVALGRRLARAHQELRRRLGEIRDNPGEHRTLTDHCLAFCAALTAHHQGEDSGMFTELLRERPDLAGTVRNLVDDHDMIASILARVAELAGRAATAESGERAAIELDGLAAIMENHFRYEERAIGDVLDRGVADAGWAGPVFRFEPAGEGRNSA